MALVQFEQKVKQNIIDPSIRHQVSGGYGMLLGYDPQNNTATVQVGQKNGITGGHIYKDVPCPTHIGVQTMAPEAGRPCYVEFHGTTSDYFPVITHFFNHVYNRIDYVRQNFAQNTVPRYMQSM